MTSDETGRPDADEERGPLAPVDPSRIDLLIVDDTAFDRERIEKLARRMGELDARVVTAASIPAARALIGTQHFDVALIDYHLGSGYGDEIVALLGERQQRCATVMVSSHPMSEVSLYGLRAGATAALSKDDLDPVVLETTIRFAMANRARAIAAAADRRS